MTTDINWDKVLAALQSEDWHDSDGGDGQERTIFLGTVFGLYPSGKYYTPWANSNVDPCPQCGGSGDTGRRIKRRVIKKWQHARERFETLLKRHPEWIGNVPALQKSAAYRYYRATYNRINPPSCPGCGGCGSREAFLDEQYGDLLESEANERGLWIGSGEGDPCDVLVGQSRDMPECERCGESVPDWKDEDHTDNDEILCEDCTGDEDEDPVKKP